MSMVDVLIPTFHRPASLAVTLAGLAAQTWRDFRIVISDQSDGEPAFEFGEVKAMLGILNSQGRPVDAHRHLPRRGMAEQRQFLLDQVQAPYAMFLDDDVLLEPFTIEMLLSVIQEERCGFVGNAVIGLSYAKDQRPHEQGMEVWQGRVEPEYVHPHSPAWERYRLHNAANIYHVQQKFGAVPENPMRYKVAWIGGCVLYDTQKLRSVGGFGFWEQLPEVHAGEDVLAQLRVMANYGGCGVIPSGAYHLELPTTIPVRDVDAPRGLGVVPMETVESLGEPSEKSARS